MFIKGQKRPNLGRAKLKTFESKARCYHFKNRAARDEARKLYGDACEDMATRIIALKDGTMAPKFFEPVLITLATHERAPVTPSAPRRPDKLDSDPATRVAQLAQMNPNGFRQPSSKAKKWRSTSLVEQLAIKAGHMEPRKFERSKRGLKKLEAQKEANKRTEMQQIGYYHDPETGKAILVPWDRKYWHSHERRRVEALEREMKEKFEAAKKDHPYLNGSMEGEAA